MRWAKYIFALLFLLCYRGLSAQEFDLYDFRYYKLFESKEELLAMDRDSTEVAKFAINPDFSTNLLDYNFMATRYARRGVSHLERTTTLNGVVIPYVGRGVARKLQLRSKQHHGISPSSIAGETELHIDSIRKPYTDIGIRFLSRNMPYSASFATAQLLPHDWSIATNVVVRTGRDLFVEGLFGHSAEVSAVATKRINKNNNLGIALFVAPSMRSSRLSSTEEAFRLTGNNLYNPSWGYQNGKVRNSRIRREVVPTLLLAYDTELSAQTKLEITASASVGIERYSALDWFDAQTPTPDNYRYMPSYFKDSDDIFSATERVWRENDTRYTQIDFDRLIATNRINGGQAVYAISDRVTRLVHTTSRALLGTKLEHGTISYGLEITTDNRRNYKQMRDLLGAQYIVDLDYFLIDDDTYGNSLQNNLATPSRRIAEGDRFGYDYALRKRDVMAVVAYDYAIKRFRLNLLAKVGYSDISRKGFYCKELFASSSFGVSQHAQFAPYLVVANGSYILGDNHALFASLSAEARAVEGENLFLQSQYNNRLIDFPTLRKGYGAEVRYLFQQKDLSIATTLFATATVNDTTVQHIYDDLLGQYVDVVVSGIDIVRYGLEAELQYCFAKSFRTTVALCMGRYAYADNARISAYSDAANILLVDDAESHIRNLSLGNAPQIAVTAGLSYYKRGWWAAINANYAGLRYVEPSAVMRTERVLAMAVSPEERNALLSQERLRDAFTIDLSLSKSLYLDKFSKRIYRSKFDPQFTDKYPHSRLVFKIGVDNLLGSKSMVYSGREASRLQRYKIADDYIYTRQATRYLYAYPRTYEVSISLQF